MIGNFRVELIQDTAGNQPDFAVSVPWAFASAYDSSVVPRLTHRQREFKLPRKYDAKPKPLYLMTEPTVEAPTPHKPESFQPKLPFAQGLGHTAVMPEFAVPSSPEYRSEMSE